MAEHSIDISSLKPNSHKSKEEAKKKLEKVVSGKVVSREKPLSAKFAEVFLSDDVKSVKGYVIFDVLIPAIKNALSEMITGGINMILFGESRSSYSRKDPNYTSYGSYRTTYKYGSSSNVRDTYDRRERYDYRDIILESKAEAQHVIDTLVDMIEDFGQATVADLYDAVGITSDYTDNKWGWVNLKEAYTRRVREGYLLVLPKATLID